MEGRVLDSALDELERVYAFVHLRVGNRADAEDLTQQVALKALPRLREGAPVEAVRSYLFATARSVLGAFWSSRLRLPETELGDWLPDNTDTHMREPSVEAAEWLEQTLAALPPHYRQVLELRFLSGASIREVARDMNRTPGAVKVLQLRALRAAAATATPRSRSLQERRLREVARGSAFVPRPSSQAVAARPR
jgi:RNA polymerase sigma factor (sigma-70 family)